MNTSSTSAPWVPYSIPKTPNVSGKEIGGKIAAIDPYILSPMAGAKASKNPSEFLEYNQIPIDFILKELERLEELIKELEELIKELEARIEVIESRLTGIEMAVSNIQQRLDNASIEAECVNGTVVVTLNL
jgi:septal ring factor EnvC (AmiA/AmiB activator)